MRNKQKNMSQAGFSLVEMLVVIAVIGIISSIAIPNIGRINESANESTYQRNAQSIATVFASAQAAGLDFSTGKTTEFEIIEAVMDGGEISDGVFAGSVFGVPGDVDRATDDVAGAAKYLTWDSEKELLLYIAAGGSNSAAPTAEDMNNAVAAYQAAQAVYDTAFQKYLNEVTWGADVINANVQDFSAKRDLASQAEFTMLDIYNTSGFDKESEEVGSSLESAFGMDWEIQMEERQRMREEMEADMLRMDAEMLN